jgi:branched-chain amino acid transport system substrate-binding protein
MKLPAKFFARLVAFAAAALLLVPSLSVRAAKPPIEVGMAVSQTGFLAANDAAFIDGVKLAVKAANDAGGIDGHEVHLHILDNASNATTGVTATNQLLNQYNVSVMINGLSSAQNAAIEPIVERAKVPMLVYSELPPSPAWAFIANTPHYKHVDIQLAFVKERLHAKAIAIVFSQTPFGQIGAQAMAAGAQQLGLTVLSSSGVEGSTTDMTPLMSKIKDSNPDVVIDIVTGSTHIVETKAATTVGLKVPIVMTGDDIGIMQQSTAAYSNVYFSVTAPQAYPNVSNPRVKAKIASFLVAYRAAGLDPANLLGASYGWDAVTILAQAVKGSGATGGDALRAALEKVAVDGTNSSYRFTLDDHTGQKNVPNPIQIGKLQGSAINVAFSLR